MSNGNIDIDTLKQVLRHDPDTGLLWWLPRTTELFENGQQSATHRCRIWNARWANKPAFTAIKYRGYRCGAIFGKNYQAHRVVFALENERWPDGDIDHIDGDTSNNTPTNLREVSASTNHKNTKRHKHNTSGVNGVSWDKDRNKWMAHIQVSGKSITLGRYVDKQDAINARTVANEEYGFTKRHGKEQTNESIAITEKYGEI